VKLLTSELCAPAGLDLLNDFVRNYYLREELAENLHGPAAASASTGLVLITRSLGPGMAQVVRQFLRGQADHGYALFRQLHEKCGSIIDAGQQSGPVRRRDVSSQTA
jgi:hypothetical protein